jgi:nitroreductase
MAKRRRDASKAASKPRSQVHGTGPLHHAKEAGAIAGELAGAVVGSAAGPVGAVTGMILGGVAGALTGKVLEDEQRRSEAKDSQLDEIIGVMGGEMGVPRQVAADQPSTDSAGAPTLASGRGGPDHPTKPDSEGTPAGGPPRPLITDLLELIELRESSRGPFDPNRQLSPEHLGQILEAARWAPTAHNMQNFLIVVVDDRVLLDALSTVHPQPTQTFIDENRALMSFSETELRRRRVGLLASEFPESWYAYAYAPGVPTRVDEAHPHSILGARIKASAALMVILYDSRQRVPASEGDVLGMMSLGCVMENMWLAAQALGVGFHVQSRFDSPEVESEIQRILSIPTPFRIGFAVRLGYPTCSGRHPRVRRSMREVARDNGFGKTWSRSTGR